MIDDTVPLISIIIPVYNTCEYLPRCVESLLTQTHANLEIILIDDGSTDGSGELCDELAKKDVRIHAIHQSNAGVSAARNAGLDIAGGDWIGFVDSDDWIEPDMYEELLRAAMENGKEVAACGYGSHNLDGKSHNVCYPEIAGEVAQMDALEHVVRDRYFAVVWSMIYKREAVLDSYSPVKFDVELHGGEDRVFITEVFLRISKGLMFIPKKGYHYCKREDSAINTFNEKKLTIFAARERILELVSPVSDNLARLARYRCMDGAIYLINLAVRNKRYEYLPMLKKSARRYAIPYFMSRELNVSQKLRNLTVLISPRFSNWAWETLQKQLDVKRLVNKMNSK